MASNTSDTEDCTNILLLGNEDVKYRFLNSLANYVEYRDVEELFKWGLKCLIPQNITYMAGNSEICLDMKQSKGIFSSPGATYGDVASYIVYGRNNKKICLIDLQGASKESGIETIFSHYTYLHSILIVLEEDISKGVEHVEFIKRNFSHVSNSILENISYMFTQVEMFDQNVLDLNKELTSRNVPIVSGCHNVYSMDAYMFSDVAKNKPMTRDKTDIWKWSRKNCLELLSYIQKLQPCTIKKNFPSWDTMLELQEVLAEISVVLQINLLTVKCTAQNLSKGDERKADKTISLVCLEKVTPAGGQALICKSSYCSSKNIGYWDRKTDYKVCHTPCNCIESCTKIGSNYCSNCYCKKSEHEKVQYLRKPYHQVIYADGKCSIHDKLQHLCSALEKEKVAVLEVLALIKLIGQTHRAAPDYYLSFTEPEVTRLNREDDAVYAQLKHIYIDILADQRKMLPDNPGGNISENIDSLYNLEHTGQMLKTIFSTSNQETEQKMQKTSSTSSKACDLPQVHSSSAQEEFPGKSYSKAVQENVVPSKGPKKNEVSEEDRFFDCDDGASIINDIGICHAKIAEIEEKLSLQNENIRSDLFYIKGYLKQNKGGSADQLLKMFEELETSIF